MAVELGQPPVQHHPGHAERVARLPEPHTAGRIGSLLLGRHDLEYLSIAPPVVEGGSRRFAEIVPEVAQRSGSRFPLAAILDVLGVSDREVLGPRRLVDIGTVVERAARLLNGPFEGRIGHEACRAFASLARTAGHGPRLLLVQVEVQRFVLGKQTGRNQLYVFGKEAADEIVAIADAGGHDLVRGEQDTWVLHSSRCEHIAVGPDRERIADQCRDADAGQCARVSIRHQLRGIRIQVDGHILRTLQCVAVADPEARGRAELDKARADAILGKRKYRSGRQVPMSGVVVKIAQLTQFLGARIVRLQVRAGNRPTAIRYPRSRFEVDRLQRAAPASPVHRGAPQAAQPGGFQRHVVQANLLAAGEVLGAGFRIEPAAFQYDDFLVRIAECERQRDACCTGADDAQVRPQPRTSRDGSSVDDQLRPPGS